LIAGLCLAAGIFSLTLGLLAQRNSLDFIPLRDYRFFIEGVQEALPRQAGIPSIFQPEDVNGDGSKLRLANE
jgi:hypothetical protein